MYNLQKFLLKEEIRMTNIERETFEKVLSNLNISIKDYSDGQYTLTHSELSFEEQIQTNGYSLLYSLYFLMNTTIVKELLN